MKFLLHVSQKEQLKRLEERKVNPRKQWKFNKEDIADIDKHKNASTKKETHQQQKELLSKQFYFL